MLFDVNSYQTRFFPPSCFWLVGAFIFYMINTINHKSTIAMKRYHLHVVTHAWIDAHSIFSSKDRRPIKQGHTSLGQAYTRARNQHTKHHHIKHTRVALLNNLNSSITTSMASLDYRTLIIYITLRIHPSDSVHTFDMLVQWSRTHMLWVVGVRVCVCI